MGFLFGLQVKSDSFFEFGVIGTIDNEQIGWQSVRSLFDWNRTGDGIISFSDVQSIWTYTSQWDEFDLRPNIAISESSNVDPKKVIYKLFVKNTGDMLDGEGGVNYLSNAYVIYKPMIDVGYASTGHPLSWKRSYHYIFGYDNEMVMDWSNVEYRTDDGYYNKTTGEYYGKGDYWHVLNYYANTGEIKIVNKIVDSTDKIVSQTDK